LAFSSRSWRSSRSSLNASSAYFFFQMYNVASVIPCSRQISAAFSPGAARFGNPDDPNSGSPQAQAIKGQFRRYPFSVDEPEDIARIALFLASDEARMITGAIIPADGGLSAY
jgi:NAD(P)-dependent dehydrogenase (short-subunit alcohol dehydrogenase family)